ncbi:hypothetical protein GCM10009115_06000 [Sphingopyxis soli]|uniref:Uncharacterized protein n=1 Tax=Sphingopyxis soli TaxID=592051 RepID=A0ABP3XCP8_9SPHN|nr:hypothetical protein [Sphingopyxis soli]
MARSGSKPKDVLIADLEFLSEYLIGLAEDFRAEGRDEAAELAEGWASLPIEAAEAL